MDNAVLHVVVRTPQRVVVEREVTSLRFPTETGQVGMRPRSESCVLAFEPGLVLLRRGERTEFVGTAGGLLRCDGIIANLMTPLAVVGDRLDDVLTELDRALETPTAEHEVRTMLSRLEQNILQELQTDGESHSGRARSPS
ncbi:MAG TPA: hypothetical protein VFV87_17855 [Pirellulaceae bacterium]|nr:hypothetical protein [Pirellulaceae bacterium]